MIQLNYRDGKPIYEQIKDGLRKLIVSGAIAKDEKLPSVRELASQMAINPNTIQRALRELESDGYIYTIAGKGSFASDVAEIDDGRKEALFKQFDEAVRELRFLGLSDEALCQRLQELYRDK